METSLLLLLLVGALVGASSGYLGSFMVLKRMSLVGDALSHVALPGIAIALTLGINPMLGAFVAPVVATFGIWYLSEHSEIYPEALVGVFFTASLAIGLIITPEPELLEALFGNIDNLGTIDGFATFIGAIVIFLATFAIGKQLLLGVVSEDLAKSQKINIRGINLIYLLLVGLVVALGVKFLGTLLTGAMVIIPAAAAKNFAGSIKSYQGYAIAIGVLATVIGIFVAKHFSFASGPVIVLIAVAFFAISYIFKKR